MPTVLKIEGYRFFFYSNERQEPAHVHVVKAEKEAKIWLMPLQIAKWSGYTSRELQRIMEIAKEHQQSFIEAWDEHFT